jgi:hypothetical protein
MEKHDNQIFLLNGKGNEHIFVHLLIDRKIINLNIQTNNNSFHRKNISLLYSRQFIKEFFLIVS